MADHKDIIPEFYRSFSCIAGSCPDTCCKDWDIVVNDEVLDFYNSKNDTDTLSRIQKDEDGDNVIVFENGVCPFLSADKLCSIQQKYGEEHICKTCRLFPRITQDYTEFTEYLLTPACPEAARLMIINKDKFDFISDTLSVHGDNSYSCEYMNFLLNMRSLTAEMLHEKSPFPQKMRKVLAFSEHVQLLIDDEIFDEAKAREFTEFSDKDAKADIGDVFELHKDLDVMDKDWLRLAVSCKNEKLPEEIYEELTSMALYYTARYYLTAISSYDIITTIKRAFCACVVCAALISHENAGSDEQKRMLIYQKYSKEIEHSDENLDAFTDAFLEEKFSSQRLAAMLAPYIHNHTS